MTSEFFWVNPEAMRRTRARIGLDGAGAMGIIAGEFYCATPLADTFEAIAEHCRIQPDEWTAVRQRLIDAGELQVVDGILVPLGDWHKAEPDA